MIYSNVQDMKISRLGFGCMRFKFDENGEIDQQKVNEMFDLAISRGVNYLILPIHILTANLNWPSLKPYPDIRVTVIISLTNFRDIPYPGRSIISHCLIWNLRNAVRNTLTFICFITLLNGLLRYMKTKSIILFLT